VLFGHAGGVDAEAVASGGEHVEFGGDLGGGEGLIVDGSVAAVGLVVFGLEEEGRRGEGVGGVGGVEGGEIGIEGEVGGVDDDGEVGAGVDFWVGFGCRWGGFDVVVVGMGGHQCGQVGAGGEADDADFGGVDVPLGGVGAGEAHGLLGVFEVGEVCGVVAGVTFWLGNAVFDEDAGDADAVEPVADVGAFSGPGEALVAPAGEDEGGGSVGAVRGIDGEGGFGDVGEADGAVSADEGVRVFGDVGFGFGGLGGLGSGCGPEREDGLLGVRDRTGESDKAKSEDGERGG